MLDRVKIKNFKCFPSQEFELAPLTVLCGTNGAGKSSLIQALLLIQESLRRDDKEVIINPDDVFENNIGAVSQLFSHEFQGERQIEISAWKADQGVEYTYELSGAAKQQLKSVATTLDDLPKEFLKLQYLNAERLGPRLMHSFGEYDGQINSDGSNASYLLETADEDGLIIPEELRQEDEPQKLSYQVEKYLAAIMGKLSLHYDVDYENAFVKTTIQSSPAQEPVSQPLTGFGYSYAYPIVVAGLLCTCMQDTCFIVENPEAHLHPSAQSNMGKFLGLIACTGTQVIVETHSEHIVDGMRIQMMSEKKTDQFLLHFFEHGKQSAIVREITVNKNGELSAWPAGFFDQKQMDLRALLEMRRKA
jgi:predicted ATPase